MSEARGGLTMENIIRPTPKVLPDSALVPEENRVSPPDHFTHEVTLAQPFYFQTPTGGAVPSGEIPPGTKVALERRAGAKLCWVVDGRGLRVATAYDTLKPL
jgi:hypothetical protein